jgi:hypothetical protein
MLISSPSLEAAIELCEILAEEAEREPAPWGQHRAALLRAMIAEVRGGRTDIVDNRSPETVLARVEGSRRLIHHLRESSAESVKARPSF